MYVWSMAFVSAAWGTKSHVEFCPQVGFCLLSEAVMVPTFPPCAGTRAVPAFQSFPLAKRNLSKQRCKTEILLPPLLL